MRSWIGFVLGGALCVAAWGQFEVGSIVGVVRDQQQAPVAGAKVEIRNVTTNVARQLTTSPTGEFNSLSLPPGQYTIKVSQAGFKDKAQNLELAVGQRAEIDFAMELGAVSEQITVAAAATVLDTASSELGNIRPEKQIVDLPLNTRNFTQLVYLAPGVNNHGNSSNSVLQGYTSGRGTNGAVINGAPSEDVVYLFDGIQSMDTDAGMLIFFPPVDAIREFKVQTSAAPAGYGGGQGIINVTFKSGSNELHGAAYEFLRNSALDAKNFFDSPVNPIPPFRLNQFGFNFGGPVWIPKVFNGKNRLFFFGDYEGKRVRQAQTFTSTVPVDAFKTGDFSLLLPKTVIYNPLTNPRVPFPDNQIPVSMINPTSVNLVKLYPEPNLPGLVNNFLYNPGQATTVDQFDVRIDYIVGASTIFGRVSHEAPNTITPGYLPAPAVGGGPSRPGRTPIPSWQGVLGFGRSLGPNKYYEARLGYSRMHEGIYDADSDQKLLAEQLGIPNANGGGAAGGLTNFSIAGTVGLGDGSGSLDKVNNNWEIDQAFSLVKGHHELKVGLDIMTRRFAFISPSYPVGQFSFSGVYTNNPGSPNGTGYGLADFLLGHPISSQIDITRYFDLRRYEYGLYVQDNFRVSSKLTLNFGLRDDLLSAWTERHNLLAGFVPTGGGNLVTVGNAPFKGNSVMDPRWTNLGPRAGFAYNVTPKTVIRGGAGIFYAFQTVTSNLSPAKNAPFSGSLRVTNNAADFAGAAPISAGFPAARPELFPVAGTGYVYYPPDFKLPSMNEWNLNIQRELWANTVLTVAYVGGKGTHVLAFPNVNQPIPGPGAVNSRRPYPNLSDGSAVAPWGDSIYNSLQTTFERRFSKGFTLLAAWTWSHSIDNSSGTGSETIQNSYDLHTDRGNSTFDTRHNVTISSTYELPFGKGKALLTGAGKLAQTVAGGWQLNAIATLQTGAPFTVTMLQNTLNTGTGVQWPNRIASGVLSNRTINAWFDTSAFVAPGNFNYGNAGRNALFGPGTDQFDLSLFKNFALGENQARRLQFRAEAFNAFNTPQFDNPDARIGFAGAGKITAAGQPPLFQRTSREIQLALKLYF
jgi:Carboxypeptidase regulatory-like domain/TonB dependent receptor